MKIFFRDDDLGWDTQRFQMLLQVFLKNNTKLNVAAIPKICQENYVKGTFADYAELLQIHTHGYAHINWKATGKRCEFDEHRSLEVVRTELTQGMTLLQELFPLLYFPAFTPPWNNIAARFLPLLPQIGYRILSRSTASNQIPAPEIQNLDVSINLHSVRQKLQIPLNVVLEKIKLDYPKPLGILLHHTMMDDLDFAFLDQLLKLLAKEHISTHFFSEFANEPT
ncbi:MAG: hypothetical protein CK425_11590 [Parachlamydia sp.]|nr:MAG: hypothetical protein CK425_11590 [Parachlamydia sp.]